MEMAEGIGQGRPGGSNGISGGGFGRGGGSSGGSDSEGIAQKGEGLLAMLAELDITQESYSQYLQALLMDVSATGGRVSLRVLSVGQWCWLHCGDGCLGCGAVWRRQRLCVCAAIAVGAEALPQAGKEERPQVC